uniref:Retrovirus-related Pol polyprotein from transposon TNT 1-94 n=1 Tax=Cannabis sativa TaxID=3483 RepID=A0A803QCF5_CANSA
MATSKFEVEKFDGKNDFCLWKAKMMVLKKVINEGTAHEMWVKLEQLYMSKTLPNRINLKQRFYGFKIDESKSIDENIDEFTKLVLDFESIKVEVEEEDHAIFLLNSLPRAYESLRDTLKMGKRHYL